MRGWGVGEDARHSMHLKVDAGIIFISTCILLKVTVACMSFELEQIDSQYKDLNILNS